MSKPDILLVKARVLSFRLCNDQRFVKSAIFGVILVRIQPKCRKIRTRTTANTDTFQAVQKRHHSRFSVVDIKNTFFRWQTYDTFKTTAALDALPIIWKSNFHLSKKLLHLLQWRQFWWKWWKMVFISSEKLFLLWKQLSFSPDFFSHLGKRLGKKD